VLVEETGLHDETYGVKVAESTIWRLLDRHGMTYNPKFGS